MGGEGVRTPATSGTYYDVVATSSGGDSVRIIPPDVQTGSYIVRAWNNSNPVYFGWDEDVTVTDGFPLEDGDFISINIDNSAQDAYIVANTAGVTVRILATN